MQNKLFYEDEFDALNQMIIHSIKTSKEVSCFLFPHLKPESAYARLKACLNPEKDERLTFGQIIAAMNFCQSYDPLMFACDESLHARPDRRQVKDEEVRLVEAINGAAAIMIRAMNQLENLKGKK